MMIYAPNTATAGTGLHLAVSKTQQLDPAGETVTVTGSGYPEADGIYVAFCVVPPPGRTPTPCGGGVDLGGDSGASAWISSNPPDYGVGLAIPYGPGGSFRVSVRVSAMLNSSIDCRLVQCAIVSRADHTHVGDRHLDVIVPVFFAVPPTTTQPVATTAAPATAAPSTTTPLATSVVPQTPSQPATTQATTGNGTMPSTGGPPTSAAGLPSTAPSGPLPGSGSTVAPLDDGAPGSSGVSTTTEPVTSDTNPSDRGTTLPAGMPTIVAASVPSLAEMQRPSTTTTIELMSLGAVPIGQSGSTAIWPVVTGGLVAAAGIVGGVLYPRVRKVKS